MNFDITQGPLPKRLFVEASAGTGKTFLIEQYVIRVIIQHVICDGSFDIAELTVITFTRACASELRDRVRNALIQVLDDIAMQRHRFAYYEELFSLAPESLRCVIQLLTDSVARLHVANICTIHSFCNNMLSVCGNQRLCLTQNQREQWIRNYVQYGNISLTFQEWQSVARYFLYDQDALVRTVDELLEQTWDVYVEGCYTSLFSSVKEFWQAHHVSYDDLHAISLKFTGMTKYETFLRNLALFLAEASPEALYVFYEESVPLSELFCTPKKNASLTIQEQRVVHEVQSIFKLLQRVLDPIFLIKKMLCVCRPHFLEFLTRASMTTYRHMIDSVYEQTQRDAFCDMCRQKISVFIVDEFQDTDMWQWRIFSSLFETKTWDGHLVFVGDPKQAIYGFRNADVYTYLLAKQSFHDDVRTLLMNFRSSPAMAQSVHALFSASPHAFYLPKLNSVLPLHEVQAFGNISNLHVVDKKCAVHFMTIHDQLGRKKRWPHEEAERRILMGIANEIGLLYEQGIQFCDQAILVRDRYQAAHCCEILASRHIPVFSWAEDSLVSTFAYRWLCQAFLVLAQPKEQAPLQTLLFMDPHGIKVSEAISKGELHVWAQCAQEWSFVAEQFNKRSLPGLSAALFQCRWNGVDQLQDSFPKEFLLDVESILDLLMQVSGSIAHTIPSYYHTLLNVETVLSETPELLLRKYDPAHAGVRVITIHKSKGLEFNIVFALGCASRTPSPDGDAEESDSEKIRQLYVAVTRAKKRCYIPLLYDMGNSIPVYGQASAIEMLVALADKESSYETRYQRMGSTDIDTFIASLSQEYVSCAEIQESNTYVYVPVAERCAGIKPSLHTHYRSYTSFSSSVHSTGSSPGLSSQQFGLLFHGAIKQILDKQYVTREQIDTWLTTYNQAPHDMADLLYHAVHCEFTWQQQRFTLASLPREHVVIEQPFIYYKDGYVRGVIDVLCVWRDHIFIIDWKTGSRDLEMYRPQMALYKRAALLAYDKQYSWGGCYLVFVRELPAAEAICLLEEPV